MKQDDAWITTTGDGLPITSSGPEVADDEIKYRGKVYKVGNTYHNLIELYKDGKFVRVIRKPKSYNKNNDDLPFTHTYKCELCNRKFTIIQHTDICVLRYCPVCGEQW